MTEQSHIASPHGVLVSADAGTPFALAEDEALELSTVLERVAAYAAGPLGREAVLARRPSDDVAWIAGELQTVAESARLVRENRGVVAEPVPEIDSALSRLRVAGSVLEGSQLLAIRRTVLASRLVVAELKRVAPDAPRTALYQRPLPEKGLERRLTLAFDDDGQLLDSASPTLAAARREVRAARERLVQKLDGMLRHLGGEGTVTLRDGRYVIPVARELRGRPDGIVHGESASGATLFIEPSAVIGLGNELREAELRAEREELQVYRDLTEMVRPERETLAAIHSMCVAVDDLVARARYAAAVDGHAPVVELAPAALTIVNGRHPLLLAATAPTAGPPATERPQEREARLGARESFRVRRSALFVRLSARPPVRPVRLVRRFTIHPSPPTTHSESPTGPATSPDAGSRSSLTYRPARSRPSERRRGSSRPCAACRRGWTCHRPSVRRG